jgi:ankyrin repeat protein
MSAMIKGSAMSRDSATGRGITHGQFPRCGRMILVLCLALSGLALAPSGGATLADAVAQQDRARVDALLAAAADVNAAAPDGTTALHWAVHHDDVEIADRLIRAGARVNAATDLGMTALSLACTNASRAMVARLLEAGADPRLGPAGEPPLMTCARTGNAAAVEALIAHGAEVNAAEPEQGQTALMWAVSEGHGGVVRALLDRGASVDARSKGGFTPLLFAARLGDVPLARILLDAGAKAGDTAADGSSALIVATVRGHAPVAALLLERGANANAIESGFTALHWAAGSWETELTGPRGIALDRDEEWRALRGVPGDRPALVRTLLAYGADPNARVVKPPARYGFSSFQGYQPTFLVGATPLLLAALAADADVMALLAEAGADPRQTTREHTTILMAAAGLGRILQETRASKESSLRAVTLAVRLGVDVNAVNDAGNTALHGAAHIRSDEVVKFLADKGATLSVANKPSNFLLFDLPSETPLAIAERTVQPGQAPIHERTSTGDLLRQLGATK